MPKSEIDISKYLWQVQVTKLGVSFGHVLHFPIERVTPNTLVTDFITSLKDTRAQTDAGDCEVWRNTLAHASLYMRSMKNGSSKLFALGQEGQKSNTLPRDHFLKVVCISPGFYFIFIL